MWLLIAAALVTGGSSAEPLPSGLVDAYLQVQAALAEDRFEGIATSARSVEVAAMALGKEAEKLASRAKALAAAKDMASARTTFGEVSRELEAYAEKTKSTFPTDVRLAYCPMADRSWRQKGKEIRNPYYGAAMLTCGDFKN
jgi:hypothetical protein